MGFAAGGLTPYTFYRRCLLASVHGEYHPLQVGACLLVDLAFVNNPAQMRIQRLVLERLAVLRLHIVVPVSPKSVRVCTFPFLWLHVGCTTSGFHWFANPSSHKTVPCFPFVAFAARRSRPPLACIHLPWTRHLASVATSSKVRCWTRSCGTNFTTVVVSPTFCHTGTSVTCSTIHSEMRSRGTSTVYSAVGGRGTSMFCSKVRC